MSLVRTLSVWYILLIPVIAGLSTLDFRIDGFNYSGYLWAILLPTGFCLLVLMRFAGATPDRDFTFWPWLVWCGFFWTSLIWCADIGLDNVQDAMKLSMPIVVGMLAASAIQTSGDLRRLYAAFGVALGLIGLFTAAFVAQTFDREWMETYVRATALSATLVGCVFLSLLPRRIVLPIAGWGACLLVTILTSSRIATLGLLAAPLVHPYFMGKLLRQTTVAVIVLFLGMALFNTSTFQERFFLSGAGTVSDMLEGDFDDVGRFDAWAAVWDEAWRRPVLGAGVGAAFTFVPTVWEEMYHVHNDYLRFFYELGFVGLSLFLVVVLWQMAMLRRQIMATEGAGRYALSAAWLGFVALLISCTTDNTIIYNSFYTNPLFALLGAGYGVISSEERRHD